jgi:PAS domain S-box-containing protein
VTTDPTDLAAAIAEGVPYHVWVVRADGTVEFNNRQFLEFTGLSEQDALDHAQRSALVHPHDREPLLASWSAAFETQAPFEAEFRLRARDGRYRWFLARIAPLPGTGGEPTRWFGCATDIEARKRTEDAMSLVLDASAIIAGEREIDAALAAVSKLVVREFAETCALYRPGTDGRLEITVLAARDADRERTIQAMLRRYPPRAADPVRLAMLRDEARLIEHVTDAERRALAQDERHLTMLERLGTCSLIIAPLSVRGQAFGAMHLARYGASPHFDAQDLRTAQLLADRLAGATDEAQTRESERRLAETFQASALPSRLPAPPGIEIKAIYQAAEVGVNVGGDWYDAFEISPWRLVLSVGDVIGKGVNAAATMSLIRHGIRFAAQRGQEPAEILRAVDAALKAENPDLTATAFVAIMDIRESRIRFASAGHPPAVLRLPLSGRTRLLNVEPAPPLGTWPDKTLPRVEAVPLAYGSLIAMYTDGLTEFDRDPVEGERLILEALRGEAAYASTNPARYLRDAVLAGKRVHDDVAVITLAFGRREGWTFEAPDAMEAESARGAFGRWLDGVADGDVYGATVIFGELVGNVVRHAPGPIETRAEWQGSDLVLHVLDRGRGFAPSGKLPDDGLSEGGRGFVIVDALARRVDVTASRQGTHVRAVLPVTRKARAA